MEKYQELLGRILEVQSKSKNEKRMKKFVKRYLFDIGLKPFGDKFGNIYCHKGDMRKRRPFIVAHLDTVHQINKNVKSFFNGEFYYAFDMKEMEQYGVGGDDKVGIWAALAAITEFDNISIALFVQEEIGCIGSSNADMDNLKKANWLAQLDRRGSADFITAKMASKEFISDMEPIALKYALLNTNQSTITDVSTLFRKKVGVSAVNIASGYYFPHSPREVINWKDASESVRLLFEMITKFGKKRYQYLPPIPVKKNNTKVKGFTGDKSTTISGKEISLGSASSKSSAGTGRDVIYIDGQIRMWNDFYGCFEWRDYSGNLLAYEGIGLKAQHFSKSPHNLKTPTLHPPPYQEAIPMLGTVPDTKTISARESEEQREIDFYDNNYVDDDEYWDKIAKNACDRDIADKAADEAYAKYATKDNQPIKTYHDADIQYAELSQARHQLDGILYLYGSNFQEFLDGLIPDDIIKNISATLHYDTGNTVAYYERLFGIEGEYINADHHGCFTSFVSENNEKIPF